MDIQVLMFKQDDPTKCTAAKLVKFGIARQVKKTSKKNIILNPFSNEFILREDGASADSITGIDCSWELAQKIFLKRFDGLSRKLPPLLAGNPVNYSKIGKLTTAEAIAGGLFIVGLDNAANSILNKFKWGHTFYDLNRELLVDYSKASHHDEVVQIAHDYGLAA